jgi:hypothetical protein
VITGPTAQCIHAVAIPPIAAAFEPAFEKTGEEGEMSGRVSSSSLLLLLLNIEPVEDVVRSA